MRALLFVMNPRRIDECIEGFESLDVDLCWLTGYRTAELPPLINATIAQTAYDAYMVCADDCVVSQEAVDAVLGLVADGAPAATGWCRLDETNPLVNLCRSPLTDERPSVESYDFYRYEEVAEGPGDWVQTYFMGMALTTMTRDMWLRQPFNCYEHRGAGWASDYNLSLRLCKDGIPMVAARGGFIRHVKERWNTGDRDPRKRLLVGEVPAEVRIVERAR